MTSKNASKNSLITKKSCTTKSCTTKILSCESWESCTISVINYMEYIICWNDLNPGIKQYGSTVGSAWKCCEVMKYHNGRILVLQSSSSRAVLNLRHFLYFLRKIYFCQFDIRQWSDICSSTATTLDDRKIKITVLTYNRKCALK